MADYYEQTVVQQTIPDADITPLELLLLSLVFESEKDGDGWYFFAEDYRAATIYATRTELKEALASSPDPNSTAYQGITKRLAEVDGEEVEIDSDEADTSWARFFQDIVKRSSTLRYVSILSAFSCSKMRPDAFGGMATLITRDAIVSRSTFDLLEQMIAEAGLGDEPPDAPPLSPA